MSSACDLLISLLALCDPTDVTERDIKLGLDLAARNMVPRSWYRIEPLNDDSRAQLLILAAQHPQIRAVILNDVLMIRRR